MRPRLLLLVTPLPGCSGCETPRSPRNTAWEPGPHFPLRPSGRGPFRACSVRVAAGAAGMERSACASRAVKPSCPAASVESGGWRLGGGSRGWGRLPNAYLWSLRPSCSARPAWSSSVLRGPKASVQDRVTCSTIGSLHLARKGTLEAAPG